VILKKCQMWRNDLIERNGFLKWSVAQILSLATIAPEILDLDFMQSKSATFAGSRGWSIS
jgi:hypothetical protein